MCLGFVEGREGGGGGRRQCYAISQFTIGKQTWRYKMAGLSITVNLSLLVCSVMFVFLRSVMSKVELCLVQSIVHTFLKYFWIFDIEGWSNYLFRARIF